MQEAWIARPIDIKMMIIIN